MAILLIHPRHAPVLAIPETPVTGESQRAVPVTVRYAKNSWFPAGDIRLPFTVDDAQAYRNKEADKRRTNLWLFLGGVGSTMSGSLLGMALPKILGTPTSANSILMAIPVVLTLAGLLLIISSACQGIRPVVLGNVGLNSDGYVQVDGVDAGVAREILRVNPAGSVLVRGDLPQLAVPRSPSQIRLRQARDSQRGDITVDMI